MALLSKLFNNTRKPQGFLGKMMIRGMNNGHAQVTDWGLSNLPKRDFESIADFGCGGGMAVKKLLETYPDAKVTGLDYSEVSVAAAAKQNEKAISAGRCQILQGDVSHLPFENGSFQLVTAFETIYFWPGPDTSFREVCRVLETGGSFLVVCESDGEKKDDEKWVNMIDGMRLYKKEELRHLLLTAGFSKAEIFHNVSKHYLCLLAEK